MPNWKTYESSVRLLSAIIAAHPDLKLNYDGKQEHLFVICPPHRVIIYLCFSPPSFLFKWQSYVMPDALAEVGKKYGGGTTYRSVWGRMTQMKENAELINKAIEAGLDPITVELSEAPAQAGKRGPGSYLAVFFILLSPTLYTTPQIPFCFALTVWQ
jgi:hypothetical protein